MARQTRSVANDDVGQPGLWPRHRRQQGAAQHQYGGASAVREARGGKLGFNAKFIIEMGEEIGSPDLRQVCEQLREELKADLFLASDGPRLAADRPTIFLGCRGGLRIHLDVNLRDGAHHSGNWGGVLANPATILSGAIACLVDGKGRMQLDQLKPPRISNQIRAALADVKIEPMPEEPALSENWGEEGLSAPSGSMPGTRSKCWRCRQAISRSPANAIPGEAHAVLQFASSSARGSTRSSTRSGRICTTMGFRWSR